MSSHFPLPRVTTWFAALLVAVLSPAGFAQEDYATGWSGHTYLIVNTSGAGLSAPVLDYPLLVRLDSTHSAVFAQAKAGGFDLRFTKADNTTRLPHQIEAWDSTSHRAAIWVLADTVYHNRSNHALRLHWGNPAAADSSNGAAVFDTANHFQAVWHMADTANETDATLNGFTATQNGAPGTAAAAIGAGRTISDGNYFRADGTADGTLNFPEGSNYTISAWVFTNTLPAHGTILSKHDNAYALKLTADAGNWEFFEYGTDLTAAGWNWVNAPAFDDMGVWRHITGVRSEFDVGIYADGVRQDFGPSTAGSTAERVLNTDVVIGAQPTSNDAVQRPFDGTLDEVRMSSTARSGDWILLDFVTQRSGAAVVSLSDTIPIPVSLRGSARSAGSFSVRPAGAGLVFGVGGGEAAARARITLLDMRGLTVASRVAELRGGLVAWDGRDGSGRRVPSGIYAVRLTLMGADGRVTRTLDQRVPFLP